MRGLRTSNAKSVRLKKILPNACKKGFLRLIYIFPGVRNSDVIPKWRDPFGFDVIDRSKEIERPSSVSDPYPNTGRDLKKRKELWNDATKRWKLSLTLSRFEATNFV